MSLEEHPSVCTFDCPDTCSLTVTVDDGRITKVRGSDAMPFTAGVICTNVARDAVHRRGQLHQSRTRYDGLRTRAAAPAAPAAPGRGEGLGTVRANLLAYSARRHPPQGRRGYRSLGTRSGCAVQLRGPARAVGR